MCMGRVHMERQMRETEPYMYEQNVQNVSVWMRVLSKWVECMLKVDRATTVHVCLEKSGKRVSVCG